MFRHRSFWFILIITAIVWLLATMSEHNDYPLTIQLRWEGFDSARYVIADADTALPVTINANSFQAIAFSLAADKQPFTLRVGSDSVLKVNSLLLNSLLSQYQVSGVKTVTSPLETIHITLSQRQRRAFIPQLNQVNFQFADQCGLSGNPVIQPDTVWLYGDSATLNIIKRLTTSPAAITGITDSGWYTIPLNPVWTAYRDIHSSADSIRIFVPVMRYKEVSLAVPVMPRADNSDIRLRTIPERVSVTLWVPDYQSSVPPSQVEAEVSFNPGQSTDKLPVRITRFPENMRVKQIDPAEVQYVIIKNK